MDVCHHADHIYMCVVRSDERVNFYIKHIVEAKFWTKNMWNTHRYIMQRDKIWMVMEKHIKYG